MGQRLTTQIRALERELNEVRRQRIEARSIQERGLHVETNPNQKQGAFKVPEYFNRQRLYGGRMTSADLRQVGRVTRDAIETLHR